MTILVTLPLDIVLILRSLCVIICIITGKIASDTTIRLPKKCCYSETEEIATVAGIMW